MTMVADIITKVKSRYRITGTSLDTDIDDCADTAIELLAPYVKKSVVDTSLTLDSTAETITIPTAGADLRRLEIKDSGTGYWHKVESYRKDGDTVYFQETLSAGSQVRLFLRVPFTVATSEEIPFQFRQVLFDLASAEFASLLAGDKARYNVYSQSNGARAVDNMLDMADFYERRAMTRLNRLDTSEALS